MSGFEVAGIVLGAFPLAVKGVRKLATKRRLFLEFGREYQSSINELNTEKLRFILSMKKLIIPLLIPDEEKNLLLNDPKNDLWRDTRIENMIWARLQISCPLYLSTIKSMQLTIEEIDRELGIQNDSRTAIDRDENQDNAESVEPFDPEDPTSISNRDFRKYRLKFINRETNRKRLFDELRKFNDKLEKLLLMSDENSNLQKAQIIAAKAVAASRAHAAICKFWSIASQFYQALLAAWNCECLEQHHAHLLLQHRTSATADIRIVLMPFISSGKGQWPSRRIKIEMKVKPQAGLLNTLDCKPTISDMKPHGMGEHRRSTVLRNDKGKGKSNSIGPVNIKYQGYCLPSLATKTSPTSDSTSFNIGEGDIPPIRSLCETMAEETYSRCAGYFQDDERRYYLYPSCNSCDSYRPSPVTLSDLLSGRLGQVPERRDRYSLALILASSFLQLYGSPWMVAPWKKSSIYFPRDPESLSSIPLDHVSLARGFSNDRTNDDTCESDVLGPPNEIKGLDSLAVLLLELCFGRPIEEHKSRKTISIGNGQSWTVPDFVVALNWRKEVNGEGGDDFADAVNWCLNCRNFPPLGDWRKDMIKNVLEPLERCCKCLRNI